MAAVVDDQLLLLVLANRPPPSLVEDAAAGLVYTTTSWYYRLARAVLSGTTRGVLTRMAEQLSGTGREKAERALRRLPDRIGVIDPRLVVPAMAQLRLDRELNMLSAEALAVAMLADATIVLSTSSPGLERRSFFSAIRQRSLP